VQSINGCYRGPSACPARACIEWMLDRAQLVKIRCMNALSRSMQVSSGNQIRALPTGYSKSEPIALHTDDPAGSSMGIPATGREDGNGPSFKNRSARDRAIQNVKCCDMHLFLANSMICEHRISNDNLFTKSCSPPVRARDYYPLSDWWQ
jgi:hypothetical protein